MKLYVHKLHVCAFLNIIKSALTWLAGWVMGGGCFGSREGSVSPFVCTISVGPLVALFSIMGIRSKRAGLQLGNGRQRMFSSFTGGFSNCDDVIGIFNNEVSPHVVIFLEKRIVLHSSLLKLHVDAAAIY